MNQIIISIYLQMDITDDYVSRERKKNETLFWFRQDWEFSPKENMWGPGVKSIIIYSSKAFIYLIP